MPISFLSDNTFLHMSKSALFVYTHLSTFVKGDLEILSRHYKVKEYKVTNAPKHKLPSSLVALFFYLLFNIYRFDIVYIWFADYHSFLPVLFSRITGKRSVIVIGGYDICREREYRYGSFSSPLRAYMALSSIKLASANLCVSKNVQRVVKSIATRSSTALVYNGVNTHSPLFAMGKELMAADDKPGKTSAGEYAINGIDFLCVALSNSMQAFFIKGTDRFIQIASEMREYSFVLVGCDEKVLRDSSIPVPINLKVIPAIDHSRLKQYYQRSRVYCQLSRRESFSLSLAEAILFNCVPVITNVGGMPEVTGGLGLINNGDNREEIKQALLSALKESSEIRVENSSDSVYKRRVLEKFTIEVRERELLVLLSSISRV